MAAGLAVTMLHQLLDPALICSRSGRPPAAEKVTVSPAPVGAIMLPTPLVSWATLIPTCAEPTNPLACVAGPTVPMMPSVQGVPHAEKFAGVIELPVSAATYA